jgi:hypothetical protein
LAEGEASSLQQEHEYDGDTSGLGLTLNSIKAAVYLQQLRRSPESTRILKPESLM